MNTDDAAIEAFGIRAERYAMCLPGVPAIIADGSDPLGALCATPKRRASGQPFFVSVLLDDPRACVALDIGPQLWAQYSRDDDRRTAMDALGLQQLTVNNVPIQNVIVNSREIQKTLHDFVMMGDALLARSQTERVRLERFLGFQKMNVGIFPGHDSRLPEVSYTGNGDAVVVWAPDVPAEKTAVLLYALEQLQKPIIVISDGGALPQSRARVLTVLQATDALANANIVVDASISDPSAAIHFSGAGFPVVASRTSGAFEFVDGLGLYDPWSWKSVLSAVSSVTSSVCTVRGSWHSLQTLQDILDTTRPQTPKDPPLVSLIIPTYNRPELLRLALERGEQQTYPNFEVVVCDDAGADISEIVALYPHARFVRRPENGGVTKAINYGFTHSRGQYICMVADDDVIYPDHIARLVWTAHLAKAQVAHSNIILRLMEPDGPGTYRTYGFLSSFEGYLDRMEILATNPISMQGMLIARSVLGDSVLDDTLAVASDYDFVLRLSRKSDFAHSDHVTGEFLYRNDSTNMSQKAGYGLLDELQLLFERFPSGGNAIIERMRKHTLSATEERHIKGPGLFQPALRIPRE